MSRSLPLVLITLVACMGPAEETLVDELRVLAVTAEPPEVAPGDAVEMSSLVVDPTGDGFEVMTWTCLPFGDGCLEASGAAPWATLSVDTAPTRWTRSTLAAPYELAAIATETPVPLVQHWTLACAPGLCPPIAQAADGGDIDALRAFLGDPIAGMEGLPLEGTSLALSTVSVSTRSPELRAENPTVTCVAPGAAERVEPGATVPFTCTVDGDFGDSAAVWGYGTAGGWGGVRRDLAPGDSELFYEWYAPEEDVGPVDLWLVIVDGNGGLGVWETSIAVGAPQG